MLPLLPVISLLIVALSQCVILLLLLGAIVCLSHLFFIHSYPILHISLLHIYMNLLLYTIPPPPPPHTHTHTHIHIQAWYDMAMDGQLWYDMYRKRWPIGIGLEAQLDHSQNRLAVRPTLSPSPPLPPPSPSPPLFSAASNYVFPSKMLQTAPPAFVKDWYGQYKQRVVMNSPAKVIVFDFGSFSCKCAVVDRQHSTIRTHTIESVVATVRFKY